MQTQLQTFTFTTGDDAFAIRAVVRDGDTWFVAADICRALDVGNTADALGRLDADEKSIDSIDGIHAGRGNPNIALINESGLYSLVLGSRKPEAKPFKRWLTHEVLPAIARTGVYIDSSDRMGETLGIATDNVLRVEREDSALALSLSSIAKALAGLGERFDRNERHLKDIRQEHARHLAKVVRIAQAQRPSNANLDPNRPLNPDEVERFKYLLSTGASSKQIARSLNRTYDVVHRFIAQNEELVLRALQQSLL